MYSCDHVVFQAGFWIFSIHFHLMWIKLGGKRIPCVHVIIQVRVSFISDWNDLKFQHFKAVLLLPRAPTAPPLGPASWCLGFSRNSSAAWRPAPSRRPVFGRSVQQLIPLFHSLVFLLCESPDYFEQVSYYSGAETRAEQAAAHLWERLAQKEQFWSFIISGGR